MKKQGHFLDILSSERHGCDVLKKPIFPTIWKNSKFTHRAIDKRKASKERTNGKALHIGKGCTDAFEIYNTKNGKNDFNCQIFFL